MAYAHGRAEGQNRGDRAEDFGRSALYPEASLADLYDETTMPSELRTAHRKNDRAVMEAYGFWGKYNSESACVAELMKPYQKLTEG